MKVRSLLLILAFLLTACASPPTEPETTHEPAGLENGSFFAELNGFKLHYEVHGTGPVVMAVTNSWGLDIAGLRAVLGSLESRLTMVYFDPRGMGLSAAIREETDMSLAAVRADFNDLRQHLELQKVNAIGWSNGATNLIMLAIEQPEIFESVILLHGAANYSPEDWQRFAESYPELMQQFQALQAELQSDALTDQEKDARISQTYVEDFFTVSCADPLTAKPLLVEAFKQAQFSWRHSDYSNRDIGDSFDVRDQLTSITARSLILAGVHDTMPLSKAEDIHEGIANSELVIFAQSGHFAPLEEPEKFMEAVFGFLGV